MGTHEPPEHWAPVESLDPTPVWKQYALVALLAIVFVAIAAVYAYLAVLPDVATPPAALPGGRVVLAASEHPPGTTKLVTIAGRDASFFLSNIGGEFYALRNLWSPDVGGSPCEVQVLPRRPQFQVSSADVLGELCSGSFFDARGRVTRGPAGRGLDRYLVSRKGDRLIVNTDHLIQGKP